MMCGLEISHTLLHTISWAIAISLLTLLHITVGEQVPKTLAIHRSVGTALFVAKPLRFFWTLLRAPIWFLNHTSNWLLKVLFRIDTVSEGELVHSSDELALLVEESEKSSEVTETERDILINALALNDLVVRDIMTPRNEIIFLDASLSFAEIQKCAVDSQHTRFPLLDGNDIDNPIGLIHVKDLMTQIGLEKPDIMAVKRDLKEVPEMMPLNSLVSPSPSITSVAEPRLRAPAPAREPMVSAKPFRSKVAPEATTTSLVLPIMLALPRRRVPALTEVVPV